MAVYAVGPDGPGDAVRPLLALACASFSLFSFQLPFLVSDF